MGDIIPAIILNNIKSPNKSKISKKQKNRQLLLLENKRIEIQKHYEYTERIEVSNFMISKLFLISLNRFGVV